MNRSRTIIVLLLLSTLVAATTATTASARDTEADATRAAGPFDGRWTATITLAQLRRAGASAPLAARLYGPWTALYQQGRFNFRNHRTGTVSRGTFTVRGRISHLVFASGVEITPGQISECTWSVYRDRLTFKAIAGRPSLLCEAGVWARAR